MSPHPHEPLSGHFSQKSPRLQKRQQGLRDADLVESGQVLKDSVRRVGIHGRGNFQTLFCHKTCGLRFRDLTTPTVAVFDVTPSKQRSGWGTCGEPIGLAIGVRMLPEDYFTLQLFDVKQQALGPGHLYFLQKSCADCDFGS